MLYRKYRPRTFEEVRGQEHIVGPLQAAAEARKPAHAYLFAGPRGTGKTSIARIFARALGVEARDLYEMDAASNRGIDDIRSLREEVQTLPFVSPYKVYLVDEVHMLTKEAFNALLKTLEEPPPHVVFILATTEPERLPDTVRSRCQCYTFKRPTGELLAQHVREVAKKEGRELPPEAARVIAAVGEYSFRDTLGVLEKVLAHSAATGITVEEVARIVGAPPSALVQALLEALAARDADAALHAVARARTENIEGKVLLEFLLARLRAALLVRVAPSLRASLQEEWGDEYGALAALAQKPSALNAKVLERILEALEQEAHAAVPHVALELAIMDLCAEPDPKPPNAA